MREAAWSLITRVRPRTCVRGRRDEDCCNVKHQRDTSGVAAVHTPTGTDTQIYQDCGSTTTVPRRTMLHPRPTIKFQM
ncbi:MAG: hypothetical protein DMF59_06060 [Acidobacteria bacterium]|nr:MAG: hypothetical protein DMF59_06060 [Acidobacteriota bacterium]